MATGLWTIFFVNGAVLSSWAPRIPEVKRLLDLGDAELGAALFGVAAGSVPALLLTARVLRRLRPAPVCVVTAVVFSAALPLIGLVDTLWQLTAVLVLLGAASGVLDVAMNTAGVAYQQRTGRRVVSRLHGGYSLGVLAGAAGGVVATRLQATAAEHLLAVASGLVLAAVGCAPMLWSQRWAPLPREVQDDRRSSRNARAGLPVTIAVLAVSGLLIEGVVTDWSALLITRDFGASPSLGATALAVFSAAMFLSRSAGDAVLHRFGAREVLTVIAVVVAGAVMLGAVAADPIAVVVAVGLVGLFLGPVFPVAVSRAARTAPTRAATMTARVSAIGDIAYLGGPPVIGIVADAVGLPLALAAVVVLSCAGMAAASRGPAETLPPDAAVHG